MGINNKKIISFTIDNAVFDKWKIYSKKNFINSSKLINDFLEKKLKEVEEK
jgi:hypothetical protein